MALGIINRWCGNKLLWKVHAAVSAEESVLYGLSGRGAGQPRAIGPRMKMTEKYFPAVTTAHGVG